MKNFKYVVRNLKYSGNTLEHQNDDVFNQIAPSNFIETMKGRTTHIRGYELEGTRLINLGFWTWNKETERWDHHGPTSSEVPQSTDN